MGVNELISIGNSDDKLSQAEWSRFVTEVRDTFQYYDIQIHGEWFSLPDKPWQNANWCVEIQPPTWWDVAIQRAAEDPSAINPKTSASANRALDSDIDRTRRQLKNAIRHVCYRWRQDTFAWTTGTVELIPTGWLETKATKGTRPASSTPLPPFETMDSRYDPALEQAVREGWLPSPTPAGIEEAKRLKRAVDPGRAASVYLNDEDRDRIHAVLECNRREQTPGEASDSAPQQPESTGAGKRATVGVDAAQARMDALRERVASRPPVQIGEAETLGEAVQEKPDSV